MTIDEYEERFRPAAPSLHQRFRDSRRTLRQQSARQRPSRPLLWLGALACLTSVAAGLVLGHPARCR